eukprot:scaffold8135_cov417-Prasinococcus_capsulatus_cf.AAC.3
MCRAVAEGFQSRPTLAGLEEPCRGQVVALLPTDLPLERAAMMLSDESYWKRRARARWRSSDVAKHGMSWKRLYLERHITSAMEALEDTEDGTWRHFASGSEEVLLLLLTSV